MKPVRYFSRNPRQDEAMGPITRDNLNDLLEWAISTSRVCSGSYFVMRHFTPSSVSGFHINLGEQTLTVMLGDYVVRTDTGRFVAMGADQFAAVYEVTS